MNKKLKILHLDKDDQSRQLYSVYLENILNDVNIQECFSAEEALRILDDQGEIDFILSDYQLKDGTGGEIYNFIKDKQLDIPFILFSQGVPDMYDEFESFNSDNPKNSHIVKPISPTGFRDAILKIIQPSIVLSNAVKAFQKVRMVNFMRFNKVLCDVYMKITDRKYVKVIDKNQAYTREDLENFIKKEEDFLYIRNEDFEKFSVSFTKTPFLIDNTTTMDTEQKEDAILTTHAMMHELVKRIGISDEITNLAQKSVEEVVQLVKQSGDLHTQLEKVRNRKDYIYDHSYLTSIICCAIGKGLDSDADYSVKKLCMASLFHDITLENPELAMIRSLDDPRLKTFSKADHANFVNHCEQAVLLLRKAKVFPEDVETVIVQHHENASQTGFPNRIHHTKISQLTAIFIIAHEFVSELYNIEFDPDKKKSIIGKLRKKFNAGSFVAPLEALYSHIKKS